MSIMYTKNTLFSFEMTLKRTEIRKRIPYAISYTVSDRFIQEGECGLFDWFIFEQSVYSRRRSIQEAVFSCAYDITLTVYCKAYTVQNCSITKKICLSALYILFRWFFERTFAMVLLIHISYPLLMPISNISLLSLIYM